MRNLLFILLAALVVSACREQNQVEDELATQVKAALQDSSTLKPGMTRADVLKLFTTDGGLSPFTQNRFVWRRCDRIKIQVTFRLTNPNQETRTSSDTIVSVSKPYIEPAYID